MSTRFLLGFSNALVHELVAHGHIELTGADRQPAVVEFVAAYLHEHGKGFSLISTTSKALIACPDVVELYADDDAIKDLVDDLGTR